MIKPIFSVGLVGGIWILPEGGKYENGNGRTY